MPIFPKNKDIDIFLASNMEGPPYDEIRAKIFNYCTERELTAWIPPKLREKNKGTEILIRCLREMTKAKSVIGLIGETYGSSQPDLAALSILELEIFHALLSKKDFKLFVIEGPKRDARLQSFLESVGTISINYICYVEKNLVHEAINSFLRLKALEKHNLIVAGLTACTNFLKAATRYPGKTRPDGLETTFLGGKFTPFIPGGELNDDDVNLLLDEAQKQKSLPLKLVLLWAAVRHLNMAPYNDKRYIDKLPLWNKTLTAWAKAASWYGLHGGVLTDINHLSVANTLQIIRELAKDWAIEIPDQAYGGIASAHYSTARKCRLHPVRRKKILYRAMEFAQRGLAVEHTDPSGLLLIRAYIFIALAKPLQAVEDAETTLQFRKNNELGVGEIGEAETCLGYGLFTLGRRRIGRLFIVKGIEKIKKSNMSPGFLVSAKEKLALCYFRSWKWTLALQQIVEADEIAQRSNIRRFYRKYISVFITLHNILK